MTVLSPSPAQNLLSLQFNGRNGDGGGEREGVVTTLCNDAEAFAVTRKRIYQAAALQKES